MAGQVDLEQNAAAVPELKCPRRGYVGLSEFIASDKTLYIFRRFDHLAVRSLLYMQDELCELERQIKALDDADMADSDVPYDLHTRKDENEERVGLMEKFTERLRIYGKEREWLVFPC
jgi:hypothetical protein